MRTPDRLAPVRHVSCTCYAFVRTRALSSLPSMQAVPLVGLYTGPIEIVELLVPSAVLTYFQFSLLEFASATSPGAHARFGVSGSMVQF